MSAGALESESQVKEQGYRMPLGRLASRGQPRGLLPRPVVSLTLANGQVEETS